MLRPLLCSVLMVTGCGYDTVYTGLGDRSLTPPSQPSPGGGGGQGGEPDAGGGDPGELHAADLTGRTFRFTSLVLTAPITGPLADPLNGYFAEEIDAGNLDVLLDVAAHAGALLAFDVGSGGDDPPSRLECSLTGATFVTASPASLDFPNALLLPPVLPISELALGGRFDPEGEAIGEGTLTGALTLEDARATTLLGSDFETFLTGLQVAPDLDLDEDGTPDAYRFVGAFEAALVDAAPGGGGQ